MATKKNITMKQFNGTDYDTLYPKTKVEQVEGAYTQQQILANSTKGLYGLGADAVPDDALALLSRFQKGLGNEYVWGKAKYAVGVGAVDPNGQSLNTPGGTSTAKHTVKFYNTASYTNGSIVLSNEVASYEFTYNTFKTVITANVISAMVGKYFYGYDESTWVVDSSTYADAAGNNTCYLRQAAITKTTSTTVGYVNSPDSNAYPPAVSDGYTYTALGQIGAKASITTGKYTGTGKYGNTNLNSLTFSFFPKAIFIIPVATSMGSYSGQFGAFLYGVAMCSTKFDGGNGSTQCNVTITGWGTNTIKWFGASSSYQLNDSKKEYRYVAIG